MSGPSYPGDPNNQPGYPQYPQPQPPSYQPPPYQPPPYQPPPYQPPPYQPPTYQPPAQPPKRGGGGRVFLIVGIVLAVLIIACVGLCSALGLGTRFAAIAIGTRASQIGTEVATQAGSFETQATSAQALLTVTTFCGDMSTQNYATAYQQLSPALQQQYSQSQFTQYNQNLDSTTGPMTLCAPSGGITLNGASATVAIAVTRTPPTPTSGAGGTSAPTVYSGQVSLMQDSSGNWVISSIDPALHLL